MDAADMRIVYTCTTHPTLHHHLLLRLLLPPASPAFFPRISRFKRPSCAAGLVSLSPPCAEFAVGLGLAIWPTVNGSTVRCAHLGFNARRSIYMGYRAPCLRSCMACPAVTLRRIETKYIPVTTAPAATWKSSLKRSAHVTLVPSLHSTLLPRGTRSLQEAMTSGKRPRALMVGLRKRGRRHRQLFSFHPCPIPRVPCASREVVPKRRAG
ncbi:hypothetical protein C8Q73DRAFT_537706 [Cubamyces lactineus]|nr:hypothetical protein C8Q73DRAFT_537706 [Cubamyces lactineus]